MTRVTRKGEEGNGGKLSQSLFSAVQEWQKKGEKLKVGERPRAGGEKNKSWH